MSISKKYKESTKLVDKARLYGIDEAVSLMGQMPNAKFDETIDLAISLGVDPKKADQMVRGTLVLPNGTGKVIRLLVIAQGADAEAAKEAGADFVGHKDMIEKIQKGWVDFDAIIATPDVMRDLGRLGKILGPRGLMPSPKAGTVTKEVVKAIEEFKAGKIEFRVDRQANLHMVIGKKSFDQEKLKGNFAAAMQAVVKARPASARGTYIKNVSISSTMGCGIRIDTKEF
jgi:large subunit ribosomal protein L1